MNKTRKAALSLMSLTVVLAITTITVLAYFQERTGAVTNTFVGSADLFDGSGSFTLDEGEAVTDGNGNYVLVSNGSRSTSGYTYDGLKTNSTVGKDPTLHINKLAPNTPAYLFVEVVDSTNSKISWSINHTNWTLLSGVTGKQGGTIYVYRTGSDTESIISGSSAVSLDVQVLSDNSVTILDRLDENSTLNFYGYLCQANGFASATVAFNACF